MPKLWRWLVGKDYDLARSTEAFVTTLGQRKVLGHLYQRKAPALLYLPGTVGNAATVNDNAAIDITGNIDIRTRVRLATWTAPAGRTFCAKWRQSAGNHGFRFIQALNTKSLRLDLSADGTADVTATADADVPFADGDIGWVRVTWDSTSKDTNFYTSTDGDTWTQLGTTQALNVASIRNNAIPFQVGQYQDAAAAGTSMMAGDFYRLQLFASTDGSDKKLDIDFTKQGIGVTSFVEDASTLTVNVIRSSTGTKAAVVVAQEL